MLTNPETLLDRLEKFYRKGSSLSEEDTQMCERLEKAFSLMCEHRIRKDAENKYIELLKDKGILITRSTAARDMLNAEQLFAPIFKYQKEYLKLVVIESAIKDIKRAERLMDDLYTEADSLKKDGAKENYLLSSHAIKVLEKCMNIKDKAEKRIIDASGLNLTDPNLPDFSKLQMNQFNINVSPKVFDMLSGIASKGVIDVTDFMKSKQLKDGKED